MNIFAHAVAEENVNERLETFSSFTFRPALKTHFAFSGPSIMMIIIIIPFFLDNTNACPVQEKRKRKKETATQKYRTP